MNRPVPYAEKFQFKLPHGEQWDPDVAVVNDEELMKAVLKKQEELGLK